MLSFLSVKVEYFKEKKEFFLTNNKAECIGIVLAGKVQNSKKDFYGNRNILVSAGTGQFLGDAFACADFKILPVIVFCV